MLQSRSGNMQRGETAYESSLHLKGIYFFLPDKVFILLLL